MADIFLRDRDTDADGVFDEAGAVATTRISVSLRGRASERVELHAGDHAGRPVRLLRLEGHNLGAPNPLLHFQVYRLDRTTNAIVLVSGSPSGDGVNTSRSGLW